LENYVPQLSLHSPIGDLTVSEDSGEIVALDWGWGRDQTETPVLLRAKIGSAYRRRVWQALREIPAGQTRTYIEISRIAGGSARSVGSANAHNPIAIFIPCHRVVAVAGIGGYSGGDGVWTKQKLLALEQGGLI
jgi:methylated-DNA-[protein]-cysteine S-methyltransferase